jgi:hypothetical protein
VEVAKPQTPKVKKEAKTKSSSTNPKASIKKSGSLSLSKSTTNSSKTNLDVQVTVPVPPKITTGQQEKKDLPILKRVASPLPDFIEPKKLKAEVEELVKIVPPEKEAQTQIVTN